MGGLHWFLTCLRFPVSWHCRKKRAYLYMTQQIHAEQKSHLDVHCRMSLHFFPSTCKHTPAAKRNQYMVFVRAFHFQWQLALLETQAKENIADLAHSVCICLVEKSILYEFEGIRRIDSWGCSDFSRNSVFGVGICSSSLAFKLIIDTCLH